MPMQKRFIQRFERHGASHGVMRHLVSLADGLEQARRRMREAKLRERLSEGARCPATTIASSLWSHGLALSALRLAPLGQGMNDDYSAWRQCCLLAIPVCSVRDCPWRAQFR